jgi:nitrite reductase (NADH) large subunit
VQGSRSCGSCTGLVESLLALTLGDEVKVGATSLCKCTSFTHDDARRLILEKDSRRSRRSCRSCTGPRPTAAPRAARAQLLPAVRLAGEYEDDQKSRFVNERLHANIQKDGTYSVVPRMWGGLTNPTELRAIADVVEKYDAPMVKVTGRSTP